MAPSASARSQSVGGAKSRAKSTSLKLLLLAFGLSLAMASAETPTNQRDEDEVELQRAAGDAPEQPAQLHHQVQSNQIKLQPSNRTRRRRPSRIYRIRAASNADGKFGPPLKLLVESPAANMKQANCSSSSSSSSEPQDEQQADQIETSSGPIELAAAQRRPTQLLVGGEQTTREVDESLAPTAADSRQQQAAVASNLSIASLLDEFDSQIVTNRSSAQLSCDSGEMILRLNFTDPFKGIVYPEHNRLSPCRFFGDAHHNYELRLPLRGCGTRQAAPRVFVNDVIIRFHRTLELEEDEIKTIICRYPPPSATSGAELTSNDYKQQQQNRKWKPAPVSELEFESIDGAEQQQQQQQHDRNNQLHRGHVSQLAELAPNGSSPFELLLANHYAGHQPNSPLAGATLANLRLPSDRQQQQQQQQQSTLLAPNLRASSTAPAGHHQNSGLGLILLISSLLFLVLLAIGLIAGFLCLRRQRNRRHAHTKHLPRPHTSTPASASAILRQQDKRARRHFVPAQFRPRAAVRAQQVIDYTPAAATAAADRLPSDTFYATPTNIAYTPTPEHLQSEQLAAGHLVGPLDRRIYGTAGRRQRMHMAAAARGGSAAATLTGGRSEERRHRRHQHQRQQTSLPHRPGGAIYANAGALAASSGGRRGHLLDYRDEHKYRGAEGGGAEATSSSPGGSSAENDCESKVLLSQQQQQQPRQSDCGTAGSKLYIKRIEDFYITKFTETKEQEYCARDTRRPLAWSEWLRAAAEARQKSPESASDASDQLEQPNESNTNTNLRSLTELDVADHMRHVQAKLKEISQSDEEAPPPPPQQQQQQSHELEVAVADSIGQSTRTFASLETQSAAPMKHQVRLFVKQPDEQQRESYA